MAKLPSVKKRSRVMGLPIGRRKTDWRKVGTLGLGAASALATGWAATRAAVSSNGSDAEDESGEDETTASSDEQSDGEDAST